MNKIIPFFFLLFLSLTSCIEIVEEITLHKDKSGNIKYRLETNQISSFLNSFSDFIDLPIENRLKTEVEKFALKIKHQEGIDSVKFNIDEKSGYSLLTLSFTNQDALNNAIYSILGYKKKMFSPKYIKITNHNFQRKNFSPWVKKYLEKEKVDIPGKELISMVTFKTIINYPVVVKKFKGKNLSLSTDRLKITQKNKLNDVFDNKTNVSIKSKQ
jgi:hypothetical protein